MIEFLLGLTLGMLIIMIYPKLRITRDVTQRVKDEAIKRAVEDLN